MTLTELRAIATTKTPLGSSLTAVRVDTDDLLALLDAVGAAKQLRECLHFVFNMDLGRTEGTALNHARASFDAAVARLGK